MISFSNRREAGKELAQRLEHLRGEDLVVLGLPRGGVPVAFEIAAALGAPLDVIVVRKLGVPHQPELAMGAIGEDGVEVLKPEVLAAAGVTDTEIGAVEQHERAELERRASLFRGHQPRVSVQGRIAIIVDDGIATGSTAQAACAVARAHGAARVVLAVPVAPAQTIDELAQVADEVVCLSTPDPFFAVGQFYRSFTQTTDGEVVDLLGRARRTPAPSPSESVAADPPRLDHNVVVDVGVSLVGHLVVPEVARGLVIFAHGSGSSRHSPRNRFVASRLGASGFATLLFDLLTHEEELDRARVFDIELLANRLGTVTGWAREQPELEGLSIGYFGASTGAAAALWAASEPGAETFAVVSRGGRPDLAGPRLHLVRSPTLLIVGDLDETVLWLNQQAQLELRCETELSLVPGASHLFVESGTLEQVAQLAASWFGGHVRADRAGTA
jgi:putative phosphoribosyl transferase